MPKKVRTVAVRAEAWRLGPGIWRATCGPLSANGETEREALQNLQESIAAEVHGLRETSRPLLVSERGWVAVVYREPDQGWRYAVRYTDNDMDRGEKSDFTVYRNHVDAERAARAALAHQVDCMCVRRGYEPTGLNVLLDPQDRAAHTQWLKEKQAEQSARQQQTPAVSLNLNRSAESEMEL